MNLDEIIENIIDNLVNGNLADALNMFRTLTPFQAAYASVIVQESESVSDCNKRWLMNALYNAGYSGKA